jgi:hypothetical protein
MSPIVQNPETACLCKSIGYVVLTEKAIGHERYVSLKILDVPNRLPIAFPNRLYHPDVVQANPGWLNQNWRNFWGLK